MYLSELKLFNFRKFGVFETEEDINPCLSLQFNEGINLLVGENDSGKTAILDAIRYTILTQSFEYIRLENEDFHLPFGKQEKDRATELRIECVFRNLNDNEAKNFLEWLSIEKVNKDVHSYSLKVSLVARRKNKNIYYDIKAGPDEEGSQLNGEVRNLLRATYLKPLRDAEQELAPKRNSRLSQILDSHEAFKDKNDDHYLLEVINEANQKVRKYFQGLTNSDEQLPDQAGKLLMDEINKYLASFSGVNTPLNSNFSISTQTLKNILEKLSLGLLSDKSGLGSHNLLFIATELLLLKRKDYTGLRLALIEEIEAHLHTQAQLRLIDFLQEEAENSSIQLILTTHSPVLASKINLKNLIICKNENAFPMGPDYTELLLGDYLFLERFLDSTKSNLFFANGVIFVEGDAENLLLPALAQIIDRPLSNYGASVVNVGNTAFMRYARIFKRHDPKMGILNINVACITDNDIKPDVYKKHNPEAKTKSDLHTEQPISERRKSKEDRLRGQGVEVFISPEWTLEYDIGLSILQKELFIAVLRANKIQNSDKFGLTETKRQEVNEEVNSKYKEWEENGTSNEERAFYIYHDLMLLGNVSKSITAQCLAQIILSEKIRLKPLIIEDKTLEYLINAIAYVTNSEVITS